MYYGRSCTKYSLRNALSSTKKQQRHLTKLFFPYVKLLRGKKNPFLDVSGLENLFRGTRKHTSESHTGIRFF